MLAETTWSIIDNSLDAHCTAELLRHAESLEHAKTPAFVNSYKALMAVGANRLDLLRPLPSASAPMLLHSTPNSARYTSEE